jgi:aryl-alcohol dehydrogenase-like predicted oxidoreductase
MSSEISRREWLGMTLGAGASIALTGCGGGGAEAAESPSPSGAAPSASGGRALMKRPIPSTGEMIPVIGLGTSATFQAVAGSPDYTALKDVMRTMVENGASVFDTAPSYGNSEEVGGAIAAELGITNRIFWATKVNVARGGTADPAAARAQIESSFTKLRAPKIDLIQVHNLADVPTQLGILKELKREGRVRYIGVTTTSDQAHGRLEEVMRNEPIDFVGLDYAVDDRGVEATTLPLAMERKIGVLVYVPFGRRRLWSRVAGQALPEWASEFGATTWAQFFLKYILGNPAVTAITPATSQARNMLDNIGGGIGRLPDAAMRQRMAAHVDALPPAPGGRGRGGL